MSPKAEKTIWIINHYATETFFDKGGRHYWFAKYLKRMGYSPVIFGCNVVHGRPETFFQCEDKWFIRQEETLDIPFVIVQANLYEGNGLSRICNMLGFYKNVLKAARQYGAQNGKPIAILASSVHPFALKAGMKLGKEYGIPCLCEIRDLWPESILAYSSSFSAANPLIKALYRMEKNIYKDCDALIFTMEGGYQYIRDKGWEKEIPPEKVYYINNGIDGEEYYPLMEKPLPPDADLEDPDSFKVIYTGSIRQVNDVGFFLDAARLLKNERIKILIYGGGEEKEALAERIRREGIENVVLKGTVSKETVPAVLNKGDLLVFHMIPSSIQKYGLSLNKMFEYLAAGKPLLTDTETEYNPALQRGAGLNARPNDAASYAEAMERFAAMDKEEYNSYCGKAREAARQFDFARLTEKLAGIIQSLISEKGV